MYKSLFFGVLFFVFLTSPLSAQHVSQQAASDNRARIYSLLKEATRVVTQIESSSDRFVVLARIGDVSWRAGQKMAATESFDKAVKIVDTLPQENPDQDLRDEYRASIARARAQAGDIKGAQQTLSLVLNDSGKVAALSDIALAQARAKNFVGAVQTATLISDPDFRDQNFEWIANQQASAGDTKAATQLARTIKNPLYKTEALAYIAEQKGDEGHAEELHAGIQEALGVAAESEPTEDGTGRSSFAACGSKEPEQPGDAALERIAATQARTGDIAEALETIKRIHDEAATENILATVAKYQADAGDFDGARASATAIRRDGCRAVALDGIAVAQFETGNLSAALLTIDDMTDPVQKANTLTYLAGQLVEQGISNSATMVLGRARITASQITDDMERADVLQAIARIQVLAGNRNGAAKTLAEAVPFVIAAHEQDKNAHRWSSALPNLVEQQAEMGDLDGAWASLGLVDDGDRKWVVERASSALSKAGDIQGALAWADRQFSPRDRALALVGAAEGILERSDSEKE